MTVERRRRGILGRVADLLMEGGPPNWFSHAIYRRLPWRVRVVIWGLRASFRTPVEVTVRHAWPGYGAAPTIRAMIWVRGRAK